MQKLYGYVVAALIIGLVVGTGVSWVVKPVPPPGPEWVSKADYLKALDDIDKLKKEVEEMKEQILFYQVLDYMEQMKALEELLPEENPRDVAFTTVDMAESLAKYYKREVITEDVKTALRILCLLPTKPPRPLKEIELEKKIRSIILKDVKVEGETPIIVGENIFKMIKEGKTPMFLDLEVKVSRLDKLGIYVKDLMEKGLYSIVIRNVIDRFEKAGLL